MNLQILAKRIAVGPTLEDRIERRMYFVLGRFSSAIRSVVLTIRTDTPHSPRRWLNKRMLDDGLAGVSDNTRSSRCAAISTNSSSNRPSTQTS